VIILLQVHLKKDLKTDLSQILFIPPHRYIIIRIYVVPKNLQ